MAKKSKVSKAAVKGGQELANKLRGYAYKGSTGLEKAIEKGAYKIEGGAKRRCPVDTGYLRASITHQLYPHNYDPYALVGTNTDYAPYPEFGTEKQAPQPYLRPAFESNIEEIKKEMEAAFKWK